MNRRVQKVEFIFVELAVNIDNKKTGKMTYVHIKSLTRQGIRVHLRLRSIDNLCEIVIFIERSKALDHHENILYKNRPILT